MLGRTGLAGAEVEALPVGAVAHRVALDGPVVPRHVRDGHAGPPGPAVAEVGLDIDIEPPLQLLEREWQLEEVLIQGRLGGRADEPVGADEGDRPHLSGRPEELRREPVEGLRILGDHAVGVLEQGQVEEVEPARPGGLPVHDPLEGMLVPAEVAEIDAEDGAGRLDRLGWTSPFCQERWLIALANASRCSSTSSGLAPAASRWFRLK